MPAVNPENLRWARETAGLSLENAAAKLGVKDAHGLAGVDRLAALEAGDALPSRPLLVKMTKQYRRPLVAFYMSRPPRTGDRGQDYRTVPDRQGGSEALVDALVRDVRARQSMVRSVLQDEEEAGPLPFVGSMTVRDGVGAVLADIRRTIGLELPDFRTRNSPESAFAFLRDKVEEAGVFVLLIGNLGSHHSAIDVEAFRGFALADPIAPFVVINDQDAKTAWSFTLLHELAHIWLGATGVSGASVGSAVEQFCNDVAGAFLLPDSELALLNWADDADQAAIAKRVSDFAEVRHLSRSMVAYRLMRAGRLGESAWTALTSQFRQQWRAGRDAQRERDRQREGGPSYYIVRRHKLGAALLRFVSRSMAEGSLSPTKAAKVLGVKPRSVAPLLSGAALAAGQAA